MTRSPVSRIAVLACTLVLLVASPAAAGFVTFESGQVRPLALSPDGSRLFAVNTPDGRLEIFAVGSGSLTISNRCRSASSRSLSRRGRTPRCGS